MCTSPQKPEEGIGFPETRVTVTVIMRCPCGYGEAYPLSFERAVSGPKPSRASKKIFNCEINTYPQTSLAFMAFSKN